MASWGGATRPLLLQPQFLCWMTQACGRSKLGSTKKDRQRYFQCEVRNLPSSSRAVAHFLALKHIKSVHSQSTLALWKESRDDPLEGNLVSCINVLKFIPPSLSQMTVLWVLFLSGYTQKSGWHIPMWSQHLEEDQKFNVNLSYKGDSLGYIRPCLKKINIRAIFWI